MSVKRSEQEIDGVINEAIETQEGPSRWPGQTYESGVVNALRWASGEIDENPMAE